MQNNLFDYLFLSFLFLANWEHMEVQGVETLATTRQWNIWASEK